MKKTDNSSNEQNFRQTTAFVFDRFYRSENGAVAALLGRFLIAAAISFFAIGYVFSQYDMPVDAVSLSLLAVLFTAGFSAVFAFVKRRIAIPIIAVVGSVLILWGLDAFWDKFSYFWDALILQFNGRVFDTTTLTVHPLKQIQQGGIYLMDYVDGAKFGSALLCAVFSMITAAGLIGKPHILPSLASLVILLAPLMASERLSFDPRIIPLIALYAGAIAVGVYYRDGLAIRQVYVVGGYRRKIQMDDRRFNAAVASQSVVERTAARGLRYSKYFSSIISAAAMFTLVGFIVSGVFRDSRGINYQPFYEKLASIGKPGGSSSINNNTPFKNGPEANYFVSPTTSIFGAQTRMQLTSPSRSTKEILRVTKSVGVKPLYLRGDIGIDFDGETWSSAVVDEPRYWRRNNLNSEYFPIEYEVLGALAFDQYAYYDTIGWATMHENDISVEYLCDTDVVFTPAYDSRYSAYERNKYSLFGDYAARRGSDKATGETLSYTALIPTYTDGSNKTDLGYFLTALRVYDKSINGHSWDDMLLDMQSDFGGNKNADYDKYKDFVHDTYLDVPEKLKPSLEEFIEQSGLNEQRRSDIDLALNTSSYACQNKDAETLLDRYVSAMTLSQYLKDNYTYSLDSRIDRRNPVMSFLNDTKSGHCALYASAMTLILREWGIPARYCTGFAASADLKMQTLRSKDLHAWCEVYLDGMGWVTFDPTASAIFGGASTTSDASGNSTASESSAPVSETSSESSQVNSSTPTSVPESLSGFENSVTIVNPESSDGTGNELRLTFKDVLPYILTILGIAAGAAVIAAAIILYVKLKNRADKQIQSFHRDENSELVYSKLLDVLRFRGLSPGRGEQPHEFFKRAETSLEIAICDNYKLLERLAFGQAELDTSERAILGFVLEKIYRAAEKRLTPVGKIRLRLLILRGR
ncbi:MAG: transglutaminase-like domain-containing protein [Oscillospiraceae bacterium]|nr:transglutaminase-like domain-containing protein [Oscillospiraceae bacterium]